MVTVKNAKAKCQCSVKRDNAGNINGTVTEEKEERDEKINDPWQGGFFVAVMYNPLYSQLFAVSHHRPGTFTAGTEKKKLSVKKMKKSHE